MTNKKFAAFIVTYNRPDILMDTIQKCLNQTRPPEKLLIVDNNDNEDTKNKLAELYPNAAHIMAVSYTHLTLPTKRIV